MDQYLPRDASLLLGESTDFPFLPAPLSPRQIIEKMVQGLLRVPRQGNVAAASPCMPDLSREGPFDVHQDTSWSGASPRVLGSLRGCQYRMTSYDEDTSSSEFNPAYNIHLHDPRLLEYVGAPESARLLSRSPEYWLHHMGREKTLAAALQLQHDVGLILSNLQVLQQFVTSLNRMSSEVMRVAFDREPFPSEAVQYCGAGSPCSTDSALHGGHGIVASTQYKGDSWPPAVVVVQRVHVLCRLSGSPTVAVYDSGVSVFPLGKARSVVDIVLYEYSAT